MRDIRTQVPDVCDGFPKGNHHKRDLSASAPGIFMRVYLDESGDTGWAFSHPFRQGGSSRFLCLAFLFVPNEQHKIPKRVIAEMYKKYNWRGEKKASQATMGQKLEFCGAVNGMLARFPTITIDCIVAKKENVLPHIRADSNKLYNYMCKLVMIDRVKSLPAFEFIPDKRSVKVESGNSLSDYLRTVLWFECLKSTTTKIINNPQESDKNYNLQFVDWIAHCVRAHFEDNEQTVFNEIGRRIKIRHLFF